MSIAHVPSGFGAVKLLLAAGVAMLLVGCSSLEMLNRITGDPTTEAVTVSYGPSDRQRIDVYPVASRLNPSVDLIRTAVAADNKRPLVIFFYGGSWNSGSRSSYRFVAKALNDLGYVVAIPDYRLTPEVVYPEFLLDSAAAVRELILRAETFGADPKRIILMGHSAGAYNAAMLAMDPRWLSDADRQSIRGLIGLAAPVNFLPIRVPTVQQTFGWPDTPRDTQPIEHVSKDDPPTLFISADRDILVDPQVNSLAIAEKMRAAGVPVEVEIYGGAVGHATLVATLSPSLSFIAPTLERVRGFIDRVTQ
jgi:acetyl esterase/lipase